MPDRKIAGRNLTDKKSDLYQFRQQPSPSPSPLSSSPRIWQTGKMKDDNIERTPYRIIYRLHRLSTTRNNSSATLHHSKHQLQTAVKFVSLLHGQDWHWSPVDMRVSAPVVWTAAAESSWQICHTAINIVLRMVLRVFSWQYTSARQTWTNLIVF